MTLSDLYGVTAPEDHRHPADSLPTRNHLPTDAP
jgi:hypothetical protein